MTTVFDIERALREAINRHAPTPTERNLVARRVGVNRTYVAMISSGSHSPLPLMFRIAAELGVKVTVKIDGKSVGETTGQVGSS